MDMPWMDVTVPVGDDAPDDKEAEQVLEYERRHAKPRFYTDENFPAKAVGILRDMGARVVTAHDAGLRGHPDENHAAFALKKGYVLLTCDRDYMDERRFPLIHCPGIVVFDFGSDSLTEMRQSFRCLRAMFRLPQFFDKWVKIDAKPEAWTEYVRFLDGTTARFRHRLYHGKLQEWVEG